MSLPINQVLPRLLSTLETQNAAVLIAPPGAGKTTLTPLALLSASWRKGGKILLLEPRRLAARAAAQRLAALLDEPVGKTVGYQMRFDSCYSKTSQILVITEGIFSRLIVDDPELNGIDAVLFDEFHERSLDADFGLALALEVQTALRPTLRLVVMSATLDGTNISHHMQNAPLIESEGRSFPINILYTPPPPHLSIENAMAKAIRDALVTYEGSILAFLPGQKEIKRTATLLAPHLPPHIILAPLYGMMEQKAQDEAIKPPALGTRKIVLSTSIAETSLTIEDVKIVIDSGLARYAQFEASSGMTILKTQRVSQASIHQRAGRAGRQSPGVAIRLWHKEQTPSLPAFTPPEILSADLSSLVLEATAFGVPNITDLPFITPPPHKALHHARALLSEIGALDNNHRLTNLGRQIRTMALPPRLASMLIKAKEEGEEIKAAQLAILLAEPGLGGSSVDLEERLRAFQKSSYPHAQAALALAARLAKAVENKVKRGQSKGVSLGKLLLYAWPHRLAKATEKSGQFQLINGRRIWLDSSITLAHNTFIVAAEIRGKAENARVLAAAPITEEEVIAHHSANIQKALQINFDPKTGRFKASEKRHLGALTLNEAHIPVPQGEAAEKAVLTALHTHGLTILPWNQEAKSLRQRLHWLHHFYGNDWPSVNDHALLTHLDQWLLPFLEGQANFVPLAGEGFSQALLSLLPYSLQSALEDWAPKYFYAPSGARIILQYKEGAPPLLSIRPQDLYGMDKHPTLAQGKGKKSVQGLPLIIELLSPANRPIQVTQDLPRFWRGSWLDVRRDMRSRYPKHFWPENPMTAQPKPRTKH